MKISLELVTEEIFTFTPNDGKPEINIFAGRLREYLLEHAMERVIPLIFPEIPLDDLIARGGLEPDRMASMTEEEAGEPIIMGEYPGGTHIMIDGAHRQFYWASRGVNTIKGWMVPYAVWSEFTFDPADIDFAWFGEDGSLLPQRRGK